MKSMTQVMQNLVKPYINNEDTKIGLRIDQLTASKIGFDGTPIGYSATKTQAAIEEADGKIDDETTAREELSDYVAKTGVKNIARSYAGYALGTNSGDPIYTNEVTTGILSLAEIEPNATYIISKTSSGDRFRVAGFNSNDINDSSIRGTEIWASPNASTVTTYEYTNTAGYKYLAISFNAVSSTTIDEVKPMVREKIFEDNTDYDPYAMVNSDLTGSALNEHENGAVNIAPNRATTPANPISGITYIVNSNKTVNASGTATGMSVLTVASGITFKKGVYRISGTPSGGNLNTGYAFYLQRNSDYSTIATDAANNGGIPDTFEITDETTLYNLNILVRSGYAISGTITFKPMITRADYPLSDYAHYVPYTMSNRELTDNVVVKDVTITPKTGVTIDYNGTHKIGNLVILNFRFLLDASFSVAQDVPIVTIDAPPLDAAILVPVATAWDGDVGGIITILKSNNTIKLATSGHFVAGRTYVVNATYVCA